jgi:DNA-directed RNA polymerase specialized sigma24 family protein
MSNVDAVSQLEKTLKLLAIVAIEGRPQREQVSLLDKAGFRQSEIALMLGSTSKAISVRLAEIRRARKGANK